MAIQHRIDPSRGIVYSEASGDVDGDGIRAQQELLRSAPDFRPSFDQLLDFTRVERITIESDQIRNIAEGNPFGEGARRAAVVNSDLAYGLLRMFQAMTDLSGHHLEVFRDLGQAREWLGLED